MRYVSTRGAAPPSSLSDAIARGLASDGGLYVPDRLPGVDAATLEDLRGLPALARAVLHGFFEGDRLQSRIGEIADGALDLPAPTTAVEASADPLFVLELFHGPTAAFKDFGARFLAESMQRLRAPADPPLTILVATSGDTGGAVAAAFHRRPWVRIVILYPKGLVSPRQEQQLTCWGENVESLRVDGTFDDCQRLVKEAFVDPELSSKHHFSSANSINIGRLLPQMVYYVASSLEVRRRTGQAANFVIPAGNLGNGFAAVWARAIGMPIGRIVLAHNANRTVPDFLGNGQWRPRPSVPTLASAMDVGNPSNMERLRLLFPDLDQLRDAVVADSVDDEAIRERIRADYRRFGREWCPHTATAAEVYNRLPARERAGRPWVLVATAHPAKFNEVVEPLLGKSIEVPESLARLLRLPRRLTDVAPNLGSLAAAIE
ncbi:MAG: threonine synthase [Steroidobacteraceae bacterium]|nr:threonine synthase [Steroidobacteraceae bacterium]